jgi:prepilin-type N-terminal cleavage/methylation domain-containing protein
MLDKLRQMRQEEGFTLIELLIVIIILAILAAIVIFAVGQFASKGRQKACKTDYRSVETAEEAYKADKGSYVSATKSSPSPNPLVPGYLKEYPNSTDYQLEAEGSTTDVTITVKDGVGAEKGKTIASCDGLA